MDDNYNMCHVILCNENLVERPNAANIAAVINDAIEEWDLAGKLQAVVHDNASAMIAACRQLDEIPDRVRCNSSPSIVCKRCTCCYTSI